MFLWFLLVCLSLRHLPGSPLTSAQVLGKQGIVGTYGAERKTVREMSALSQQSEDRRTLMVDWITADLQGEREESHIKCDMFWEKVASVARLACARLLISATQEVVTWKGKVYSKLFSIHTLSIQNNMNTCPFHDIH